MEAIRAAKAQELVEIKARYEQAIEGAKTRYGQQAEDLARERLEWLKTCHCCDSEGCHRVDESMAAMERFMKNESTDDRVAVDTPSLLPLPPSTFIDLVRENGRLREENAFWMQRKQALDALTLKFGAHLLEAEELKMHIAQLDGERLGCQAYEELRNEASTEMQVDSTSVDPKDEEISRLRVAALRFEKENGRLRKENELWLSKKTVFDAAVLAESKLDSTRDATQREMARLRGENDAMDEELKRMVGEQAIVADQSTQTAQQHQARLLQARKEAAVTRRENERLREEIGLRKTEHAAVAKELTLMTERRNNLMKKLEEPSATRTGWKR